MFNIGDFVIIIAEAGGIFEDRFIIDKIKSIDGNLMTFVNFDTIINTEDKHLFKVLPYEEGLPYLRKSKIIKKINKIIKDLSVDYGDYEDVSEEELNDLLLKVQSLEEDIKNVNQRYLRKYKE